MRRILILVNGFGRSRRAARERVREINHKALELPVGRSRRLKRPGESCTIRSQPSPRSVTPESKRTTWSNAAAANRLATATAKLVVAILMAGC